MHERYKKPGYKYEPAGPFSYDFPDQFLARAAGNDAESLLGESGLIGQLRKWLAQRVMTAKRQSRPLEAIEAAFPQVQFRTSSCT
jgi:hypothetical protein